MPITINGNGAISGLGDIDGHDLETATLVVSGDTTIAPQAVGRATLFVDETANRVGINTTTPSSLLEISDNEPIVGIFDTANNVELLLGVFGGNAFIGTESNDRLDINTGGGAKITILDNGNVGIGTTAPDRLLSVSSTNGLLARFIGPTNNLFISNDRSGLIDLITTGTGDSLTLGTESTEKVRVTNTGRVGIGVTDPAEKLDIGPEAVAGGFKLSGQSVSVTSNGLTIDYQPNIGLPTAVDRVRYFAEPRAAGDGESEHIFYAYEGGSRQESGRFTGNGLAFPNGNGIDFSASEGASATSSILDDYEEGIHETTMTDSLGGALSVSPTNKSLQYVKIGNMVFLSGRPLVGISGGTGYVRFSLPFAIASLPEAAERSAGSVDIRLCDSAYEIGLFNLQLNEGSAFCTLTYGNSNDSVPSTPAMVVGTQIWIAIAYRTA